MSRGASAISRRQECPGSRPWKPDGGMSQNVGMHPQISTTRRRPALSAPRHPHTHHPHAVRGSSDAPLCRAIHPGCRSAHTAAPADLQRKLTRGDLGGQELQREAGGPASRLYIEHLRGDGARRAGEGNWQTRDFSHEAASGWFHAQMGDRDTCCFVAGQKRGNWSRGWR